MRRTVYLERLPHSVYIVAFYEIAIVSTRSARFLSRDRLDRFDARTTPPFQFPGKNAAQPSRGSRAALSSRGINRWLRQARLIVRWFSRE